MKILAVIPARAGSKGIPNKNIRILNNKPLISYSIENAKNSKYITDIIVTTDSDIVRVIAAQMGVDSIERKPELCGDNITLDSVIYDAIPKKTKWDYIITMQPTSPTLQVETLDKAIEYTIKNKLDTVISAINRPHLSWKDDNGRKIPNYTERLNRQYLPANYMETGAFVISKFNIVTEKTRIGKKVDVFEVSESESIDIDNFSDMIVVSKILENKKIAIYVNGNNKRGVGHIYRALEIADEFNCKPDIYFDKNQTSPKIFGQTTHTLIPVDGIADLFQRCKKEKYTLFINDILTTSIDYMIGLKSVLPKTSKIVNFEDDGEGASAADLVFNALYQKNTTPNVRAGEKYYIPGKLFLSSTPIQINPTVKNIFVAFGGADPQNYTDRVLEIISKEKYDNLNFTVVLGRAKHNIDKLLAYNTRKNITVLHDIQNMPVLMSQADIAITSRGRTGYELSMLGVPSIAMAQNEREEKHGFVCDENGFNYIGLNPSDAVIEANLDMYINMEQEKRQAQQNILLTHDLKNGRKRVMSLINNL